MGVLNKLLPDGDYELTDGCAWFKVKGFAIRIHSTDEGVVCDVYVDGAEMEESLASCYAYDAETAPQDDEDYDDEDYDDQGNLKAGVDHNERA